MELRNLVMAVADDLRTNNHTLRPTLGTIAIYLVLQVLLPKRARIVQSNSIKICKARRTRLLKAFVHLPLKENMSNRDSNIVGKVER
jgi:hypothetical protein